MRQYFGVVRMPTLHHSAFNNIVRTYTPKYNQICRLELVIQICFHYLKPHCPLTSRYTVIKMNNQQLEVKNSGSNLHNLWTTNRVKY